MTRHNSDHPWEASQNLTKLGLKRHISFNTLSPFSLRQNSNQRIYPAESLFHTVVLRYQSHPCHFMYFSVCLYGVISIDWKFLFMWLYNLWSAVQLLDPQNMSIVTPLEHVWSNPWQLIEQTLPLFLFDRLLSMMSAVATAGRREIMVARDRQQQLEPLQICRIFGMMCCWCGFIHSWDGADWRW